MIIDMHIHTTLSPCSVININELLQRARFIGLDGICITDHDTTDARFQLNNINDKSGLCVIIGMEYTTPQGDFLVFGDYSDLPSGLNAWELYECVRKKSSIAIPCHPHRKTRPTHHQILESSTVIEVINGRNNHIENELSKKWLASKNNGTKGIGGSDAHTTNEIGRVVTVFERNIYSVDDLIRELYSGHYGAIQRVF
jgi:predicted metal-dependent phosphoesterase TrpH